MSFWLQGMREDAESDGVMALASGQLLGDYLNALLHLSPRCAVTDAGSAGLADVVQLPDFTARAFVGAIFMRPVVTMWLSNSWAVRLLDRNRRRRTYAFPAYFGLTGQASPEDRCRDSAIAYRTNRRF
jgi:hypothetical protein